MVQKFSFQPDAAGLQYSATITETLNASSLVLSLPAISRDFCGSDMSAQIADSHALVLLPRSLGGGKVLFL